MAYFGSGEKESVLRKVQPRIILLAVWLVVCLGVLAYVANGASWLVPDTKAVASEMAPTARSLTLTTAQVLVPIEAIQAGQKLRAEQFKIEERPISGIESKVSRSFAEIDGAFAASLIAADAPLLRDYVSFTSPSNAVTSKIPDGYRGVTISVNEESAVEGWVRPGARVDVIMSTLLRGKPMVTTIVENARVLSAERSTEMNPGKDSAKAAAPSHVTLLVTLKEAQRIQVAKASGTLSLNLRGLSDDKEVGNETITSDKLLRGATGADVADDSTGWVLIEGKRFRVNASGKLVVETKPIEPRALEAAGITGPAQQQRPAVTSQRARTGQQEYGFRSE